MMTVSRYRLAQMARDAFIAKFHNKCKIEDVGLSIRDGEYIIVVFSKDPDGTSEQLADTACIDNSFNNFPVSVEMAEMPTKYTLRKLA